MMILLQKLSAVKSYRRAKRLIFASFAFFAMGGGGEEVSMNFINEYV